MKTRSFTPSKHTSSAPLGSSEVSSAVSAVFDATSQYGEHNLRDAARRTKGQCALCSRALPNDIGSNVVVLNGEHCGDGLFSFQTHFGIESSMETYSMCVCPCCASSLKSYALDSFGPGSVVRHSVGSTNVLILSYGIVFEFIRSSANAFYIESKVSGIVEYKQARALVNSGILDLDWSSWKYSFKNMRHGNFILHIGYQLCHVVMESKTDAHYFQSVDDFVEVCANAHEKDRLAHYVPTYVAPSRLPCP